MACKIAYVLNGRPLIKECFITNDLTTPYELLRHQYSFIY